MVARNARGGDLRLQEAMDALLAEADRVDPINDDDDEEQECLAFSAL